MTNVEIERTIEQTPLRPLFRGTFSRDELLDMKPKKGCEAGVLNLSKYDEKGTHWTAWFKHANNVICFYDSYGDLYPPKEFCAYAAAANCKIYYNVDREQMYNSVICGQLCLCFLWREYAMSKKKHFL